MIKRDKYLQQLITAKGNGFPKVITGIRRCGKSYLLKTIYKEYLIQEGVPADSIILIELDDDKNSIYRDPLELGAHVRELCAGKTGCFVFIDEIQKVFTLVNPALTGGKHTIAKPEDAETISFVDVVLGLSREDNIDLYITGSNSRMLSSDIITEFRDKATQIHLAPLSFEEYFYYAGVSSEKAIYSYMQYGGMPLAVQKSEEEKKAYLKSLFETTYFSDIIERNHLRRSEALEELCNIISTASGELMNAEKIAHTFQSVRHESISKETVQDYLRYFEDAFLIREAKRYDLKGRREIGAQRKYYFCDTGLRNARLNFAFPDEGQMIENIVYNELLYNGYTVNVGAFDTIAKDKSGKSVRQTNEVDFYATKGLRSYYIQVCHDLSNLKTESREVRPYLLLNDQIQKILLINRPIIESRDDQGFTVIGLADFLLRFIK